MFRFTTSEDGFTGVLCGILLSAFVLSVFSVLQPSQPTSPSPMTTTLQFTVAQTVFMIFFAIFWGATTNVHGQWRMFDWPLTKHPRIRRRLRLAFLILNIIPVAYFMFAITLTSKVGDPVGAGLFRYVLPVSAGIAPGFAALGFYRLFLGFVGMKPATYYWYERALKRWQKKDELPREPSIESLGLRPADGIVNIRVGLSFILAPLVIVWAVIYGQSQPPSPTPFAGVSDNQQRVSSVPEPSSYVLAMTGAIALLAARRRKSAA